MRVASTLSLLALLTAPVAAQKWVKPCCAKSQTTITADATKVFTRATVDSARLAKGILKVYPRTTVDSVHVCRSGYVVDVTQTSLTIASGSSDSLFATVTRCGVTVPNVTMTWTPRNLNVVQAITNTTKRVQVLPTAGGTTYVVAQSDGGGADSALVTITSGSAPVGFFVATNGTAGGPGTVNQPWTLDYAMDSPPGVAAGDTIWVRGGTYAGGFTNTNTVGTTSSKLFFKAYPGERPRIDGVLVILGDNTGFWGLEIYRTDQSVAVLGVNDRAPGTLMIHNVIHDASMSGIGTWSEAPNAEMYGNLIYNNGTHANLDHGIYVENTTGTKILRDNILIDNWAYGIHQYGDVGQHTDGITIRGNTIVNSGDINPGITSRPDIFIGNGENKSQNAVVDSNMTFRSDLEETSDLGWSFGVGGNNLTLKGNYMVGTRHLGAWTTIDSAGVANTQKTSFGTGTVVTVRPSVYDPDRGTITVYNWDLASTVSVDLSSILSVNQTYRIVSAFDFYGSNVLSGTYAGGSVNLPMTAIAPRTPVVTPANTPPTPGPRFGVFIVLGS